VCMCVSLCVYLSDYNSGTGRVITPNFQGSSRASRDGFKHRNMGVVGRRPDNLHFLRLR